MTKIILIIKECFKSIFSCSFNFFFMWQNCPFY